MKFRVIFLKKKYIYFSVLIFITLLLLTIILISNNSSLTFNNFSNNKEFKADFNGDGKEETLYVKNVNGNYTLTLKAKDKNYSIITADNSSPIGSYCSYWPMRVSLIDVSRDKIPEIFVQASNNNLPLQHVFFWKGDKFENVFSNSNNILGFIDCKNNRTPKVISGRLQNDTIWLSNYIFLNYKFKNYNYESNNTFVGKDTVFTFIKFIQSLPQNKEYKPKEIFSSNMSNKSLSMIDKLSEDNNTYIFQDAIFSENKCDKDGNTSEFIWSLNFRGVSNKDKNVIKNYTLSITLTPDENSKEKYYFKISSINLK
ncbi:VCBS repeat-containing protein [Clostridiaceae bacterium UIB06]|uniref:VCBS repeat-containing protein n=1 Tax=Clostridium thailandense TaxID=2794346 RepID=A0A949THG2_9CLOT|nr:VCBS repeat-containing protein [Clostridium thailandense]MBV7272310.1 VCBS repeat-containing protein [Clostridium thailandense]MCH5136728.1 VCBS repeat-containing protein [Clostridiaceae bacterium UIB06]